MRINSFDRRVLLGLVCALGMVGASTGCTAKPDVLPSGFLGDGRVYASLKPNPQHPEMLVYRQKEKPLADYDAFIIPPVKVYLSPQGVKRSRTPAEISELAQLFRNTVHAALADRYSITNKPGARVAVLRLALTDVDPSSAHSEIVPGALLDGAGLGLAKVEGELIDSVTGEVVAASVVSSKGKRYPFTVGVHTWEHTQGLLSDWANLLRARIDQDHGIVE
jgi:hypothetical protein